MANFNADRLASREVYQIVFDHVQRIKAVEEDEKHKIYISGGPIHTGWIIKHAFEIGLFVLLTVLATFGLLLAYFRRLHGVLIPFTAAITTANAATSGNVTPRLARVPSTRIRFCATRFQPNPMPSRSPAPTPVAARASPGPTDRRIPARSMGIRSSSVTAPGA